jgi:hypothetical protein
MQKSTDLRLLTEIRKAEAKKMFQGHFFNHDAQKFDAKSGAKNRPM